jgi:hypothetical protein
MKEIFARFTKLQIKKILYLSLYAVRFFPLTLKDSVALSEIILNLFEHAKEVEALPDGQRFRRHSCRGIDEEKKADMALIGDMAMALVWGEKRTRKSLDGTIAYAIDGIFNLVGCIDPEAKLELLYKKEGKFYIIKLVLINN